jgi:anthranilate phosphoribosyltransferase
MLRKFLSQITGGQHLSREDATRVFQIIMNGGATPAQIAAVLIAMRINGETVDEIAGAAIVMRAKMERISAPENTIDVCGTGGDAINNYATLNVSTAVALVVAACGIPVAKHGNKSVSSSSGSADVLSSLGVNIQADKAAAERSLREAGICFLYSPLYHRAMRHVTPIRQELNMRTIFNLLGPLANPAMPRYQLMGVYDKELLVPLAETLKILGSRRAWVVHGSDGMDELTITGTSHVAELRNDEIHTFEITPEEAGLARTDPDLLKGKNPDSNAHALSLLLSGTLSPYRDIVLLNAAGALMAADKVTHIKDGVMMAAEALDSGKAKEALANLVKISNEKY